MPKSTSVIWQMLGTQAPRITNVTWEQETLTIGGAAAPVGTHMIANPLAPDHEPGSVSTYDSQQTTLMAQLMNTGNLSVPNDQKYIKGHLLNDHVGGPGEAHNLFPITADANAKHLVYVEKLVKAQLAQGNVLRYEIKVAAGAPVQQSTAPDRYSIDARFDFSWSRLDITGAPMGGHSAPIVSTFNAAGAPPFDVTTEYTGQYTTLNHAKASPGVIQDPAQWQVGYHSPAMAPMGAHTTSTTPIAMLPSMLAPATPATINLSAYKAKMDVSGTEFISIRSNQLPAGLTTGSAISVGNGASATKIVHVMAINPLSGGWTRLLF